METKGTESIVEGMSAQLRRKYETVRALLSEATGDEVRARYKVAAMVLEVKRNESAYGAGAVKRLAAALGWDRSTIYRYALIAKRWDAAGMTALLRRRSVHGEPISWSHLLLVVRISPASRRAKLVDRVLDEGLSVRDLARVVRQTLAEKRGAPGPSMGPDATIARGFARLARAAEAFTACSASVEATLQQIEALGADAPSDVGDLLSSAVKVQEQAREAVDRLIERLRTAEAAFAEGKPEADTVEGSPRARESSVRRAAPPLQIVVGGE